MKDRVALITGGARGIGAGIAKVFADNGAKVMVADIGVDAQSSAWRYALAGSEDIAAIAAYSANIQTTHVDVTDAASCAAAVAATIAAFGRLDILVNNAGIVDTGAIDRFDESAWDRIFAVNCKGIFLMTQAALTPLKQPPNAAVINTASIAGKQGYANMSAYCGSKFAAIGITQSLAAELAPFDIRVNAICPGIVGTAMWLDHLLPSCCPKTRHQGEFSSTLRRSKFAFAPKTRTSCCVLLRKSTRFAGASMPRMLVRVHSGHELPSNATSREQREEEFASSMQERIPLGRPQTSQDMGEAALYLATAANVSGVALSVAGGLGMN